MGLENLIEVSLHGSRCGITRSGQLIVDNRIIGPQIDTLGNVIYVDANNGDDNLDGKAPQTALATLNEALDNVTANQGDIIVLLPGHYEDFDDTTTGFDIDVAGVTVIGIGEGSDRPRFDFNHATSKCLMSAASTKLLNVDLRPSVATVAVGLEIATGITGCVIEKVNCVMGEAGDGTDEFVKAIHLVSGNDDTIFKDVKIVTHASCNGATHGIHVDAASNRLTFDNVIIDGPHSTAGILEDAAGLNHVVVDCSIDTSGTNYSFHASSTFAKRVGNLSAGVIEDAGANLIGVNDSDNNADTSSVAANADGSALERLEYLQANGTAQSPATFVPGLGYRVSKVCSLGAANDDLFTVTGKVLVTLIEGEVTTVLSGAESFQLRIKTDNVALCAATTIDTDADGTKYMLTGDAGATMNAGDTPTLRVAQTAGTGLAPFVIGDAGGTATIESNTTGNGGEITFTLFYMPLEASAAVAAAA